MRLHYWVLVWAAIVGGLLIPSGVFAASKAEIDARVTEAIATFYADSPAGKKLAEQAAGILVFPKVIKAGFIAGGEYGEGSLLINGEPVAYYNTVAASVGFQLGAQVKTHIILFMNKAVLQGFTNRRGWEVGVDASVAIATLGVGEHLGTETMQEPIIGFILSTKGLMYDLSLEGSKITKIQKG